MPWVFLTAAIAFEICATLGLRAVAGAPGWWSIGLIVAGYALSFLALALALRHLKVGVVYAIWSGAGTAAVAVAGSRLFGDRITSRALVGIVLVVAGVIVLVTSDASRH